MGYYLRGRFLGDTPAQAAGNLAEHDIREMLLDYIVLWDTSPSEMIASGEIFQFTRAGIIRDALEDIRKNGMDYGKIQWRDTAPKASSNSKCCCGKAKCTGCGRCGSKNLAPRSSNRKTTAKKPANRRR